MSNPAFSTSAINWQEQLRRNQRRSCWVITLFILMYFCLGLLVDVCLASRTIFPPVPLSLIFYALATLQIFPYATLAITAVAVISILITYQFHDRIMLMGTDYHEITSDNVNGMEEQQLYHVVEEMKVASGLHYMPKVYVIEADYMNAFASGYSEKSAMVAITRGLMQKLNRAQLQAVMAHELSHILHQDIKLTLMASVLANLMLIVLDMLFYSVLWGSNDRDDRRNSGNALVLVVLVLRYVLPLTTVLLLLYLSRTREYMADAGCVALTRNNEPLISALLTIHADHVQNSQAYATAYSRTPHEDIRREAYLYDPIQCGISPIKSLANLFSTHPSLESRLAALGYQAKPNN